MARRTCEDSSSADEITELVFRCLELMEVEGTTAVEALLENHADHAEAVRRRMKLIARAGLMQGPSEAEASDFPDRLGEFHLLKRLGGGGMGVVYLARQESPDREVALKLIRPEHLYFPRARERFQREIEAIAKLEHPDIVPVYTAGEEGGIPYFTMELVRGVTLARIRAELSDRSPESLVGSDLWNVASQRADEEPPEPFARGWADACAHVIATAARAIHYAHTRQVLHRDLKPSNLMLTKEGRIKVLDFGLSRSSETSSLTQSGDMLGSLPYMAPEQVRGEGHRIGATTDVYALGAVLYELLTLENANLAESAEETRARVLDGTPRPVRELNPRVTWEAETVCLMAMDPDPAHRYATALDLAQDLERVIQRRPILGRRPGLGLRLRRWVQRRPAAAVAILLGAVILIGGPLAFGIQQMLAREAIERERNDAQAARDRARFNYERALAAVDKLLTQAAEIRLKGVPQVEEARRALLEDALEFFRGFLNERGNDPQLRFETALAWARVGWVQTELSRIQEARHALDRALVLMNELVGSSPENVPYRRELGRLYTIRGGLEAEAGRSSAAEKEFRKAAALLERLVAEHDELSECKRWLVATWDGVATALSARGRLSEARAAYLEALDVVGRLVEDDSDDPVHLYSKATITGNLGHLLRQSGRMEEAVKVFEESLESMREAARKSPRNVSYRQNVCRVLISLGTVYGHVGKRHEQRLKLDQAIAVAKGLCRDHPLVPDHLDLLANGHINLGRLHARAGRATEGEQSLRKALSLLDSLVGSHFGKPDYRWRKAFCQNELAKLLLTKKRPAEAGPLALTAVELLTKLRSDLPTERRYSTSLSLAHGTAARVLRALDRGSEAASHFEKAVALSRELAREQPSLPGPHCALGTVLHNSAMLLRDRGRLEDACALLKEAEKEQACAHALNARHPFYRSNLRNHRALLAMIQLDLGEHEEAAAAAERCSVLYPDDPKECWRAARSLARCVRLAATERNGDEAARRKLMQEYAGRTVAHLRRARKLGACKHTQLERSKELRVLAPFPAFQQLLREARGSDG